MPHPQAFQKSGLGMNANAAALLGYLVGIFSIVNLIVEKDNNFVRFHAVQKLFFILFWTIGYFALIFVLFILTVVVMLIGGVAASAAGDAGGIIGVILWVIAMLTWVILPILFVAVFLGGLILCAVKAYNGEAFKLPIIGSLAAKIFPV